MAVTKVEYDIDQPFDVTQLNDIGPTAILAFRNNIDLPHPLARSSTADNTIDQDNDANTIYVDPFDGNDANTGTDLSTDAVLTWDRAIALITAARSHVHIEITDTGTNGTEGTLVFTVASTGVMTTDFDSAQVAAGQTCTIGSGTEASISMRLNNPTTFNGFAMDFSAFGALDLLGLGDLILEWAKVIAGGQILTGLNADVTINDCYLLIRDANDDNPFITPSGVQAITITNTIIRSRSGIGKAIEVFSNNTIDFQHLTIVGGTSAFLATGVTNPTVTNNHSHIIHNTGTLQEGTAGMVLAFTNSLINVGAIGDANVSDSTNEFDTDPLFIDFGAETATGHQLFHIGRTTSDGTPFPVNSPAVGIGLSDAGAWDFTYVVAAETLKAFELLVIDGYKFTAIQERLNYQAFTDIQGRFHNVWDDVNWKIPFNFEGNYWQGHDQTMNFNGLFLSKTFLRYFPEGDDGLWGTGGIVVTVNTATQIDTGTNIPPRILPDGSTLAGSDQLIPNALRGFIINITWTDSGAKSGFFEILNHDESEINLEHIRGDEDITSGSGFMANVLYLPVLLDMGSVSYWNEFGTENEINGVQQVWMPQGNVTIEGTSSAEFHFREFTLRQTREEPLT